MEKQIIWTETALNQLEDLYLYVLEESKNHTISDKVVDTISKSAAILRTNWEIYEIDEMKIPLDINYRAYEIYSYRISYKITSDTIFIIRIRHTSRDFKFYSQ